MISQFSCASSCRRLVVVVLLRHWRLMYCRADLLESVSIWQSFTFDDDNNEKNTSRICIRSRKKSKIDFFFLSSHRIAENVRSWLNRKAHQRNRKQTNSISRHNWKSVLCASAQCTTTKIKEHETRVREKCAKRNRKRILVIKSVCGSGSDYYYYFGGISPRLVFCEMRNSMWLKTIFSTFHFWYVYGRFSISVAVLLSAWFHFGRSCWLSVRLPLFSGVLVGISTINHWLIECCVLDVHGCVNVLHVLWLVVVLNTTASA